MPRYNEHPSLPLELMEQVIDYQWDDNDTLAICSLVCRMWMERSYCIRFEWLVISVGDLRDFASLGRNNTLRYIRTLTITGSGEWDEVEMPQVLSILRAASTPRTLIIGYAELFKHITISSLPISAVENLRL